MKYTLKFWDKTNKTVSQEDGEKVMYAKQNKIQCVMIKGGMHETSSISSIEPVKEEAKNLLPEGNPNPVKPETKARLDNLYLT